MHETRIVVESIRGNWHYVIWYRNLTLTSVSLLVPFVLLAYWNLNTLLVMRRRQRLRNRPYVACCETSDDPDSHNPDNSADCLSAFNGRGNRANSTFNQGIYLCFHVNFINLVVYWGTNEAVIKLIYFSFQPNVKRLGKQKYCL